VAKNSAERGREEQGSGISSRIPAITSGRLLVKASSSKRQATS